MIFKFVPFQQFYLTGKIPLRWVWLLPFLIQVTVAVSLTGWLSIRNGQEAVEELAFELGKRSTSNIEQHIQTYLSLPHEILNVIASGIESGHINPQDFSDLERFFLGQMKHLPQEASLSYGNELGDYIGIRSTETGENNLIVRDRTTAPNWELYQLDSAGNRVKKLLSEPYDARNRPWYQAAVQAKKTTWSPVFISAARFLPLAYAVYPIYNPQNQLQGVLGYSIVMDQMNEFLKALKISDNGQSFILEPSGTLLATSVPEPLVIQTSNESKLRLAVNSETPLIRDVSQSLLAEFKSFSAIQQPTQRVFSFDHQPYLVQVLPLRDEWELNWLIVVVIPKADFMEQINANTRMTIVLCLVALFLTIVVGSFTSRWMVQPIWRLNESSHAIARGYWNQTVQTTSLIKELNLLGLSFNQMAKQLEHSFTELKIANEELESRVTERTQALSQTLEELKHSQLQLIQTEKLSSLGQMVGGVAHEINNPINFIHANIPYVDEYCQDLLNLLELYQASFPEVPPEIEAKMDEIELEFLQKDLQNILSSMKVGTLRIREIVQSLRNFSRLDEAEFKEVGIQGDLENTLFMLQSRLKGVKDLRDLEVIKDYQDLPKIQCFPSQLNQVFLNIINNAIDALEPLRKLTKQSAQQPKIWVQTSVQDSEHIEIRIRDNGMGIPEEIRAKIFDPFFTTKPIGQGTGLGLSISYQIIVKQHGGMIIYESEPDQGTEFIITLPIHQALG